MRTLLPTLAIELLLGGLLVRHLQVNPLRFVTIAVLANVVTQATLWAVLAAAFPHYWVALLPCELAIWLFESWCFHRFLAMKRKDAVALGFAMNGASFSIGLLLPI